MQTEFCELSRFLDDLNRRDSVKAKYDLLLRTSIEQGKASHLPQPGNPQDDQTAWITVHGIFVQGKDIADLVRLWICVATRQVDLRATLRAAETTLQRPGHEVSDEALCDACQTILDNSSEAALIEIARRTLGQLNKSLAA